MANPQEQSLFMPDMGNVAPVQPFWPQTQLQYDLISEPSDTTLTWGVPSDPEDWSDDGMGDEWTTAVPMTVESGNPQEG